MGGVDTAVEDGDSDTLAGSAVPRTMRRATRDRFAVAAGLADSPSLGRSVVTVVGGGGAGDDGEGRVEGFGDGAEVEAMSGDDSVVQDVLDVGLRRELANGGLIVFGGLLHETAGCRGGGGAAPGLHGCDSQAVVAMKQACSKSEGAGLGITG